MIKIRIYYLKQGQSSILKTIKINEDICEICNLSIKTKPKKIEKIVKKLKNIGINSVVISKEIHSIIDFVNYLYSNEISIFDGKWIGQYLIIDIINYLEKTGKKLNNDEVAILANDLTEEVKGNVKLLVKKFKKLRIITNHAEKFKKLENELLEKEGVSIIISNNKNRSLLKTQIIINLDFIEEEINKYNINEQAIITSLDQEVKINKKRFSGIVITDYEVEIQKNPEELEKEGIDLKTEDFYNKEILEAQIYKQKVERILLKEANCSTFEVVRNIIREQNIKIKELYGKNGKIQ